ncbi:porin family protein [Roseibacterium beibuensis]|uniref:porin family protein n=1 Tax=[Roseibacterium] beibuensis TaxID=1193142 RepID=UPI00217E0CFE|nr:porin family protein [Roseibacterium beibuensis]MCS6627185.1 porin family protein [Roseibacterium beibuensis]
MRNVLLATAALTLIAAPAMAQDPASPVTGSLGYTHLDADDGSLGAVTGRLGYDFTRNFGIEGEASVGVKDEDVTIAGVDGSLEHEYDAAVYGVAKVPVSENLELFGRVGYGTTSIKADIAGVSATEDGESLNYGAGANWYFDGRNGLRADWTRRDFQDDGAAEVDTYGLSYVRRF